MHSQHLNVLFVALISFLPCNIYTIYWTEFFRRQREKERQREMKGKDVISKCTHNLWEFILNENRSKIRQLKLTESTQLSFHSKHSHTPHVISFKTQHDINVLFEVCQIAKIHDAYVVFICRVELKKSATKTNQNKN